MSTQTRKIADAVAVAHGIPIPESATVTFQVLTPSSAVDVYIHLDLNDTVLDEVVALASSIDGDQILTSSTTAWFGGTVESHKVTVFFPSAMAAKLSVEANMLLDER